MQLKNQSFCLIRNFQIKLCYMYIVQLPPCLSLASHPRLTIYQVRQLNGSLHRVPPNFYEDMWHVLCRTPGGIRIGRDFLPQQPTITNMMR